MKADDYALFKEFVINSIEPIFFAKSDGKISLWNKGCEYLLGYTKEEIQNYSLFTLVDPSNFDRWTSLFESIKSGRALSFESKCITKSGKAIDVEITASTIGKGKDIYFILRDNTRLKHEMDKLKKLAAFPDNMPNFIMEWDRLKGITYTNRAVKEFFHEIDEPIDVYKILPEKFNKYMRRVVGSDKIIEGIEFEYKNHIFSYSFIPFKHDENKVLIVGEDITIQKNLQEEVDSAYKRTKNIIEFIGKIIKEFQFMEFGEKLNFVPLANIFLRDIEDFKSDNPTHLFIGTYNEKRTIAGEMMHKRRGEIKKSETILITPTEIERILPTPGGILYSNWYEETSNLEKYQSLFPKELREEVIEIHNFVSYHFPPPFEGVIIAMNYAKDVNKYDAQTIKGFGIAIGTLHSMQKQFQEKDEAQFAAFTKLAELAEKRDEETGDHLKRMSHYTRILAEEMSKMPKFQKIIDREYIKKIFLSAPLHDIGKVGIPDSILRKPGKLDDREYEIMRTHTIIGGKILEGVKFLEMASQIAYYHHEKYDGSGYPYGIKGEEIPLPARIVALADVYDAMTSKRVYKEAFTHERTKKLIAICSGGHFDPDVVNAFLAREQDFIKIKELYKD